MGFVSASLGGNVPVRNKSAEPVAEESVLPPGKRDRSGFWFPLGYDDPQMLIRRSTRLTRSRRQPPEENGDGGQPS